MPSKATKPRKSSRKPKSGGSLASDAVVSTVQPGAFDKLDAHFTNELSSCQKGGCGVCKKSKLNCLCVGGAGWKAKAMAKTKEVVAKLKSKASKSTKPTVASVKPPKKSASKRGGGVADNAGPAVPAYNYDGMLQETALTNSANNPGAATPLPFKSVTGGSGLKKLSELSVGEGYSLRNNRLVGGSDAIKPFPVGIAYKPAIVNSGEPIGYSPRAGLAFMSSPLTNLTDTTPSTVPAPMTKAVQFGNNITDVAPPAFSYGTGTPAAGGGLVKKLVVAAVAHHAYKKYKAHKKAKAAKKATTATPAPKSTSKSKSSSRSAK